MTCKDCIHYDVCFKISDVYFAVPIETRDVKKDCQFFADKSSAVEFPCKVGDTFYTVGYSSEHIEEYECLGFKYGLYEGKTDAIMLIALYGMEFIYGEEAFLTKEEAEKKLKEKRK